MVDVSAPVAGRSLAEPWDRRHWAVLAVGVVAAVAIRAILLPRPGLAGDLDEFAGWVSEIATDGFGNAYDRNLTFPPVMVYLWGLLAAIVPGFRTATDASDPGLTIALKLLPTVADVGLAAGVAFFLRAQPWLAVFGALAVLLHPLVLDLSALFGQYEAIYALFALLAFLLAVGGRSSLAAVALALAVMTKPQALPFLVPFAAWFLAREGWAGSLRVAAIGAATVAVLWLPFLAAGGPAGYLRSIEFHQNELYNILSLRAWNVWALVQEALVGGQFLNDRTAILGPITFRHLGYALAGVFELVVFAAVWRRPSPRTLALGLAASTLVAFAFLTTMHERYAYAAVVFLLLVVAERRVAWLWLAFSLVYTLNVVAAIPISAESAEILGFRGPLSIAGSIAMLAITGAVLWLLLRSDGGGVEPATGGGPPSRRDTSGGTGAATSGA